MSLSHVCTGCGFDLADAVPAREPVYGWTIRTCPGCHRCHTAQPRRRMPLVRMWRRALATVWTGFLLALQVFILIGLTASIAALSAGLVEEGERVGFSPAAIMGISDRQTSFKNLTVLERFVDWRQSDEGSNVLLVFMIIMPLVAGAWLRSALSHVPRLVSLGVFVLLLFIASVPQAGYWWADRWVMEVGGLLPAPRPDAVVEYTTDATGKGVYTSRMPPIEPWPQVHASEWFNSTSPLLVIAPLVALGMPLGRMPLRALANYRSARYRRRMRRIRKARMG